MAIEFGLSTLYGYIPGVAVAPAITTGSTDGTAVVSSGYVWIDGMYAKISGGHDLDVSAKCPSDTGVWIFAYLESGASSTASLGATSVDPRIWGYAPLAKVAFTTAGAANSLGTFDTSGTTAAIPFGRAMNCSVNISYDQAMARGGTLNFANDMKLYNGNVEGSLEYASITGANLARILGATWASGGAVSGTLTLSATQTPLPFMIQTQQITNGVTATIKILKCYSNQIGMNLDRENYTMPTLNFVAVANYEGNVMTFNI